MLIGRERAMALPRIAAELERIPALARILDAAQSDGRPFAIDESATGVELMPFTESEPGSRCRLKVFRPRPGNERLLAFFYKRSNLTWSRDRFSYGGVEFHPEQLEEIAVRSWLAWLCSGFDPEERPERLRRAFLYDIPE